MLAKFLLPSLLVAAVGISMTSSVAAQSGPPTGGTVVTQCSGNTCVQYYCDSQGCVVVRTWFRTPTMEV